MAIVSITPNTPEQTRAAAEELHITVPHLSDADMAVSQAYGVLRWATAKGTPSHTFILVGRNGRILWLQDYGAKENGGRMYVPLDELYEAVSSHFQ